MVMLSVLRLGSALLFVYSSKQSVAVVVEKDDAFLAEYIPKLEWFYFTCLIQAIIGRPTHHGYFFFSVYELFVADIEIIY